MTTEPPPSTPSESEPTNDVAPWEPSRGTGALLDFALQVLEDAVPVAGGERGRLLDLPCGTGHLSTKADALGWDVVPCDLFPEFWEGPEHLEVQRTDFNEPLPFDDASADAIAHCEGIEHVENPWAILREFRRVLRPGGTLVLSLPNTIDIRQRVRLLRRGFVGHYLPAVPEHVNRMGTFYLCHALLRTGFEIEAIRARKTYGNSILRWLTPLFEVHPDGGLPEPVRAMLSDSRILRARTVYVVARRPADG